MPRQHKGDRTQLHMKILRTEHRWLMAEAKRLDLFPGELLSNIIGEARKAKQAERRAAKAPPKAD